MNDVILGIGGSWFLSTARDSRRHSVYPYPVERLVADGDPARQIVSIARRRNFDLVFRGARGLRRSIAYFLEASRRLVLHHVGRPVVIVRER